MHSCYACRNMRSMSCALSLWWLPRCELQEDSAGAWALTCDRLSLQEQLHFRKWLRKHNVADTATLEPEANDAECEVCGTVPYFAAVRCACHASRIACPQHGAALCSLRFVMACR